MYSMKQQRGSQVIVIVSILVVLAALVILPFWHILGVGIFAALLFWMFHVHPLAVVALYLVAYCVRWLLIFLGLWGVFAWTRRKA